MRNVLYPQLLLPGSVIDHQLVREVKAIITRHVVDVNHTVHTRKHSPYN